MVIYVSFISIFTLFLVLKHDFIRCVDFIRIEVLNTASDDVILITLHIEYLIQNYHILVLTL